MKSFIIKRILSSLLIVFIVSVMIFLIMHLLPGDPIRQAMGFSAAQEDVDRIREEYHLNDPLIDQYLNWAKDFLKGDLGPSLVNSQTAGEMILQSIPKTLSLGIPAIIISTIVGLTFGIISAIRRGKAIDQFITFITTIGMGTPLFWVGILGIYVFAVWLKILPMQGYTAPTKDFGQYVLKAILPVFCLSMIMFAAVARQTRSNMLEVINQDYIRTARANGISERKVIFKYALRNALIPVITTIGLQVRGVLGGSVLVEQVFNIAGVGFILTSAVNSLDYWVVQNGVVIIACITVLTNLATDIVYGLVDPRIRESRRAG